MPAELLFPLLQSLRANHHCCRPSEHLPYATVPECLSGAQINPDILLQYLGGANFKNLAILSGGNGPAVSNMQFRGNSIGVHQLLDVSRNRNLSAIFGGRACLGAFTRKSPNPRKLNDDEGFIMHDRYTSA